MPSLPPKQLRMIIADASVAGLPDVALPDGYLMRSYLYGDADGWADVLRLGGFGNCWSAGRVLGYLEDAVRREGSRLVEHEGRIVAGTFASMVSNRPSSSPVSGTEPSLEGVLDYVVTHPDHRGKGLGRATCTEVARYLVTHGCKSVLLNTDDWRLAAIHIYLSMGFRPVMTRNDMPHRWAAVYDNLKEQRRDHP